MATGQSAFWVAADVAALDALETRLQVQEAERGAAHVAQLRTVLELHALYTARGLDISTVSHAALALGCSEHRAASLLGQAQALAELPGALEAVQYGLLSVEQAAVVVSQLAPLPLPSRLVVWRRLQTRLIAEADRGSSLPPARLGELLRGWVMEADPADAVQRRRRDEDGRSVDYRRREDGLGDLFGYGFRGPDLHAILSRIATRSAPWGAEDDRTADQRRFDAFKDLLLGREVLPLHGDDGAEVGQGRCGSHCGCLPGQPVPCGAELLVHLTLGAALGTTDEVADLVGHGPLEPDLVQELLLAAPRLRPVWVGPDGVPVAVGDRVEKPQRDDSASVREALLSLAALAPPSLQPRDPQDHRPEPGPPQGEHSAAAGRPADEADPAVLPTAQLPVVDAVRFAAALEARAHPPGQAGPYRLPRWLRRLIDIRSPRCEWPGCGARAVRCDAEHDVAWPGGPTCACNLGPCCRRHHRVKQRGWTKTRRRDGVLWAGPTGRSWLSPTQHPPPQPWIRPLPPVPTTSPLDELSPTELEDELWALDLLPEDDAAGSRTPADHEPPDDDRLGRRLQAGDTAWTLDLANPYLWLDEAPAG